jgi:hypothetical protein
MKSNTGVVVETLRSATLRAEAPESVKGIESCNRFDLRSSVSLADQIFVGSAV